MNKVTVDSDFKSLKATVEDDIANLNSQKTEYTSATSNANSKISSASFSGWEDSVATAMQNACDNLKSSIVSIDDDITGGSYSTLISKVEDLHTALDNCAKLKKTIKEKKDSLSTTKKYKTKLVDIDQRPSYQKNGHTDYKEVSTGELTDDYKALQKAIKDKSDELEAEVKDVNDLLTLIPSIKFGSQSTDTPPDQESLPPATDEPQGTPLSGLTDDDMMEMEGLSTVGIEVTATVDGVTGTYILKPTYHIDSNTWEYALFDPNNPSSILTDNMPIQQLGDKYDARLND